MTVSAVSRALLFVRRTGESPGVPEVAMQYALMIYAGPGYHEALPDAEREAVRADFWALQRNRTAVAS